MTAKFAYPRPTVTITPYSYTSLTGGILGTTMPVSSAWIAANRALFTPFNLYSEVTLYSLFCVNGVAISGNVDIGIYDAVGTKIVSTGSTGQAGIHRVQNINITPTVLGAGLFYLAMVMDNGTGQVLRRSIGGSVGRCEGLYQMAAAFPLPANATFAVVTSGILPVMGAKTYNNA